jgi:hypothetical protein
VLLQSVRQVPPASILPWLAASTAAARTGAGSTPDLASSQQVRIRDVVVQAPNGVLTGVGVVCRHPAVRP